MIKFFNTGYLSRYLILLILALIIWFPSMLYPTSYSGISSYAYNCISQLVNLNILLLTIFSFLITLLTAFLLNKIAINNGFSSKISTFIAFLYILLTSSIIGESHNNPVIWINFIMIFVLNNLMRLPYVNNLIPVIFNASFLLGFASLFYSQLVFLILFIWLSIVIHRVVTWRNLAVSLIGISLPYFFLLTWFFFTDTILQDSFVLFNSLQIDITPIPPSNPIEIIITIIFLAIIIISTFGIASSLIEKNINLRRNLTITLFYFVIIFLIILIFSKSYISTLLLSIPSALLLGNWLNNIKKVRWYNISLWTITFFIILNQYLNIILSVF